MSQHPPAPAVCRAFGVGDVPVLLAGGQGRAWRVDGLVLKPCSSAAIQGWLAREVSVLPTADVRVPPVVPAVDGRWVVNGWGATAFVDGCLDAGRTSDWRTVLEAGRAFHRAVAPLPRPAFLDGRADPWAVADRAAWGEAEVPVHPAFARLARRLRRAPTPSGAPQLVHGDLTGNVLLHAVHPPAVIDLSPYWRAPSFAEGVVVADALTWHDAPVDLAPELDVTPEAVARGLLFRVLTSSLLLDRAVAVIGAVEIDVEVGRYERATAALGL